MSTKPCRIIYGLINNVCFGLRTWLNGRLIILLSFLLLLSFCHSKPQHIPKRLNVCTVILKPPSQVIVPGMKHLITLPGMPL